MAATEGRPLFIRLTLPDGLEEALEGLAREVLRQQPENICQFAANHFEQILKKRGTVKLSQEAATENGDGVDGVDEDDGTEVENIEERPTSPADTGVRARPLSARQKKSIDVQMPTNKEETDEIDIDMNDPEVEKAATKIQAGFKGHKTRKEMKQNKDESNAEVATEEPMEEPKEEEVIDIDLNDPEVEAAATKIQAGFKGHKTRKEMKLIREEPKDTKDNIDISTENQTNEEVDSGMLEPEVKSTATNIIEDQPPGEEIDIDLNDPEVEAAATKIQAGFKGHKTRKEMNQRKENVDIEEAEPDKPKVTPLLETEANEEEIDIDLNDPEVEAAATKIQAGFKGHKTRKEMNERKAQTGIEGRKEDETEITVSPKEEIKQGEEEIDIDLNDPEVEAAATKIQAGFKGHKTRKEMKDKKTERHSTVQEENDVATEKNDVDLTNEVNESQKEEISAPKDKGDIDIDLNDPEVEAAATKIQAGFKGHQTRKEMKEKQKEKIQDESPSEALDSLKEETMDDNVVITEDDSVPQHLDEKIDIDLNDPEVEAAATKIQAGFKGHKIRKEMKNNCDKIESEPQQEANVQETVIKKDVKIPIEEETKVGNEDDSPNIDQGQIKDAPVPVEEVIDIDLEDPEVTAAATKIQAGFKGHQTRKELKEKKDKLNDSNQDPVRLEDAKETQVAKSEETKGGDKEEVDIDLEDPEVAAAATKIQAGFKGHKARKEVSEMKRDREGKPQGDIEEIMSEVGGAVEETTNTTTDADIDIDLEDPEVAAAATKIQAGFKGHKARKEVSEMRSAKIEGTGKDMDATRSGDAKSPDIVTEVATQEEVDIDLNDPEVEAAATKIQAGFKGHKARKEVAEMKISKIEETNINESEHENEDCIKADEAEVNKPVEEEIDIDLTDPEVEAAATKIQAGFKGHKARKEVSQMKSENNEKTSVQEGEPNIEENLPDDAIDIDLTDPEVEAAATKIQAGFKGHQARKEVTEKRTQMAKNSEADKLSSVGVEAREPTENETEASKIMEEAIDIDLNDPEVAAAATKIQAGFKGHQARKEVSQMKEKQQATPGTDEDAMAQLFENEFEVEKETLASREADAKDAEPETTKDDSEVLEENIDIDLEDPEVAAAATKIQAGFKGQQARKQVKQMQDEKKEPIVSDSQTNEGSVAEDANGAENKAFFRQSTDADDGYISPDAAKWKSSQNTFDSAHGSLESSFDRSTPTKITNMVESLSVDVGVDVEDVQDMEDVEDVNGDFTGLEVLENVTDMEEKNIGQSLTQPNSKEATIHMGEQIETMKDKEDFKVEDKQYLHTLGGDSDYTPCEMMLATAGSALSAPVLGMFGQDLDEEKTENIENGSDGFGVEDNQVTEVNSSIVLSEGNVSLKSHTNAASKIASMTDTEYKLFLKGKLNIEDMAATRLQSGYQGMRDKHIMKKRISLHAISENITNSDGGIVQSEQTVSKLQKSSSFPLTEQYKDVATSLLQAGFTAIQLPQEIASGQDKPGETKNTSDMESAQMDTEEGTEDSFVSMETPDQELVVIRESSAESGRVGAIPFELHEAYDKADEPDYDNEGEDKPKKEEESKNKEGEETHNVEFNRECSMIKTKEVEEPLDLNRSLSKIEEGPEDHTIIVYTESGSPDCMKVLLYLKERNIPYTMKSVSDQLTVTPTLKYGDEDIVVGAPRITTYLEGKVPVDKFPMMIPCTSSTKVYQKYIFFSALLDNIDLNALTLGLEILYDDYSELRKQGTISPDLIKFKGSLEMRLKSLQEYEGTC